MKEAKIKKDKVIEFINRRFSENCNWDNKNCYYFAVILQDRFPEGRIYYDVIWGHFIFGYEEKFYDWNGIYEKTEGVIIPWEEFDEYDSLQKERIIRDCIM